MTPADRRRPQLRVALRAAGALASVALVTWVAWRAASSAHVHHFDPTVALAAFLTAMVAWTGLAAGWVVLSGSRGRLTGAAGWLEGAAAWALSQSLRYLPGAIWAPLARSRTVAGGARAKATTLATEAVLTAAIAVGVGGVAMSIGGAPWFGLLVVVPVVLGGVAVWLRRRGRGLAERAVPAMSVYALSWTAYALSTFWAQRALGPVGDAWRVAGAACLAWAAGFAIVWMPSGLGAREVAYAALVGRAVPHGRALAGALAARLVLTVAELVTLVVLLASRRRARESSPAR